ncbi:ran binding protein in the microtubule-organising centre [Colletotrichum tamarilloi]|uniref:Ran binding protein in the microtubule-organising centre n=1 Tax=Colletotrichum tamarilloi TaxID=1209934 RepID=A0ABQ9R740_9PEZI|nr:ran binding protein in the microtubule-organising centre [Colletotrichum tamarilloi]KAK1496564.1 ran binding protein in the microtubule-organising centre [Colletotrichum tamarilloi]
MSGLPDINDPTAIAVWNRAAARLVRETLERIMTSSASTATPMKHAFERRVQDVKSPKSDINALILDYLTVEGYPNAAAKFSKEANLQPHQVDETIKVRQQIQKSIHTGSIQYAIEALNDFDSEILDRDPTLHFALLRLQLVELIRACTNTPGGDITPALSFATNHLGPRAPTDSRFLKDLEETMALLVFPHNDLEPQLAAILHPDLRRDVADDVNKAILQRQSERREAAIRQLVKMRAWAESAARAEKKPLPERIGLGLNGDESDGHDPMMLS